MRRKTKRRRLARPKAKLGLPDLEQARAAVLSYGIAPPVQNNPVLYWPAITSFRFRHTLSFPGVHNRIRLCTR